MMEYCKIMKRTTSELRLIPLKLFFFLTITDFRTLIILNARIFLHFIYNALLERALVMYVTQKQQNLEEG